VKDYLLSKEDEVKAYNTVNKLDTTVLVNGRRQTNLGVFRAYMLGYLRNHPDVHQDMTLMVRQLQPTEQGIPMEIYVFSNRQEWVAYENLQGDIFDHILAVIPQFDLRVFQNPSNNSISRLAELLAANK
jgi:miniconductance mechanosensitive channel